MNAILERRPSDGKRILGRLTIGDAAYHTLEPLNCIPIGTYTCALTVSGRAKAGTLWTPASGHRLPEVLNVPGRTAIRIHAGNTERNTIGCILVGMQEDNGILVRSREALIRLLKSWDDPFILTIREEGEVWGSKND